jgi:hypothetical protein
MTSKKRRKRQNRRQVELPVTNKDKTGLVKSFTLTITLEAKPLTTTLHKYIYIYIYKQERY